LMRGLVEHRVRLVLVGARKLQSHEIVIKKRRIQTKKNQN
jgi:hypothetical protein